MICADTADVKGRETGFILDQIKHVSWKYELSIKALVKRTEALFDGLQTEWKRVRHQRCFLGVTYANPWD